MHGDLQENIYMQQAPSFEDLSHPHLVCHLKKALYGLKQAPRAWFHHLKVFLLDQKFTCSCSDNSLFIFKTATTVLYLLVYVDDIVITGNDNVAISTLISSLHSNFSLKDLGDLHYFLGIEVNSVDTGLYLTQTRYLHFILERVAMTGAKPCKTPMQPGLKLSKLDGTVLSDPHVYRTIVGALQYATITHPDLAFSVNKASKFVANPTDVH
jgi:Reverse transcriptase (RNA-dependent DNA polymerase)